MIRTKQLYSLANGLVNKQLRARFARRSYAHQAKYVPRFAASYAMAGFTQQQVVGAGKLAAGFGAMAGVLALFFMAEIPRVSVDIFSKVPVLDEIFNKEIAPEDNPY